MERREQRKACVAYLKYLLGKNVRSEPSTVAATLGSDTRSIKYFINQSPWSHEAFFATLRESLASENSRTLSALVLGEFHVNKSGRHSAGVATHRIDWSNMHKVWNEWFDGPRPQRSVRSQMALTLTWVSANKRLPVAAQLYLPPEWICDRKRRRKAKIPDEVARTGTRASATIKLVASVQSELPVFRALLLDEHYGSSFTFLTELEHGRVPYIAEVSPRLYSQPFRPTRFFPIQSRLRKRPWWGCGNRYVDWLENLGNSRACWTRLDRLTEEGDFEYVFAEHMETIPMVRNCQDYCRERWLIFMRKSGEWPENRFRYFVSNLPVDTPATEFAELIQHLQPTLETQQRLRTQFQAKNFEGRSWRGFHHHVTLCLLAGEFLRQYGRV